MAYYNKGKIAIPNVTGDIVITITAVPQAQENAFPSKFYDTDGVTLYDGKGYKSGFRFNSSNEEVSAPAGNSITGYLDITGYNKVTVSGAVLSETNGGNKYVFYDASHNLISGDGFSIVPNGVFAKDGSGDFEIPANTKYMRFCVNTSCCTGTPPALTVVLGWLNEDLPA